MTERLYFGDSYLQAFDARVVERLLWDGHPAVILDRTAFYPTGGGQPHDTGVLGGIRVIEVVEREIDGAVIHVLAEPLEPEEVKGRIDWERRFDLMQQHTGQHILSAAFVEQIGANTVSFHLSNDYATIDLDRAPLSANDLTETETLANAIVFENRPSVTRFVSDEKVSTLTLRKPLAHTGPARIVEIPDFDRSACGGTHVGATGEIGLIKLTRSERRSSETRVEFLCGGRALADYQAKNTLVMGLAQEFTVGHWELDELVHRLAGDLKETRRVLRRTRDELLDAEASALWHQATKLGDVRVVRAHLTGRAMDDLKHLAQRLTGRHKTVALLATEGEAGEKSYFTFARSDDLDANMGTLVREACELIGGRGGGRPAFAQGGGPLGNQVAQALDQAIQSLVSSIAASH
jgi:alanyl-tRNA synthetase